MRQRVSEIKTWNSIEITQQNDIDHDSDTLKLIQVFRKHQ